MGDLDEVMETTIKEDNPQAEAVRHLINVAPRNKGELETDAETKTRLEHDEVNIHTPLEVLGNVLEMPPAEFNNKCIIGSLVNKKERKLISLGGESRKEVVQVSRQPDMSTQMIDGQNDNALKRFFTPRR